MSATLVVTPTRSDATQKLYDKYLSKMKEANLNPLASQTVIDWVKALPVGNSSKKGYLAAQLSVLTKDTELYNIYKEAMKAYNKVIETAEKEQKANPKQEEKWLSWEDICKATDKAKPETPEFFALQDWIILCLYTKMEAPLRADFAPMGVSGLDFNDGEKGNWLKIDETRALIILNEYKSVRKWGKVEFPVPEPLYHILWEWTQVHNPSGWLLVKEDGEPMNEGHLSQRVIRLMTRLTEVSCGISMIRHAFQTLADKGEKSIKEKEKLARLMLHTSAVGDTYRFLDKE